MSIVTRTAKESPRLFAVIILIALISTVVAASKWDSIVVLAEKTGIGFLATPEDQVIGTCDTAGPIEIESTGGTTTPTAYATLKDAFDAINSGTHTGAINAEVCGNTTETATASLNASGSGSASYTDVTVRPVGGARIIEGTITGAVVKLTGADNVTIDGRQGGTGTARDLTIRNNSTLAATAAIWLTSTGVGAGATNNTIRNLEIAAGATSNTTGNTTIGILMASNNSAVSVTSGGDDNDNNSFIANRIIRARYGIVTRGQTTNNNQNPIVTDNIIGPASFGPDQIGKIGILMQADNGALVSRNTVQFVGGDFAGTTAGADRVGIGIGSESWSASAPGTITSGNYTVTRNIIHDIVEQRTFSAAGILASTTGGGNPTNNLIANNFIYNVIANGTSGDQPVGIGVAGGHSDNIVFNSISMTGDMDGTGATAAATYGNAIRIANASGTTHANLNLKNNSIYMDVNSNTTTLPYFAITVNSSTYAFGTGGLDNNNYFVNLGNAQMNTGGLTTNGTAPTAGNTFNTLALWQAALSPTRDAASIQADPQYVSNTADLHIPGTSPNVNAGVAAGGVNSDIDGQLRVAAPDIGADEPAGIAPPADDISATSVVSPANGSTVGTGNSFTPQASYTNIGTNAQTGVTVRFRILDGSMTEVYNQTSTISSINPGATATVSFPTGSVAATGAYTSIASVELTGDENTGNDSVQATFSAATPLGGSVAVGAGETFTSLSNAGGVFEYMNSAGASSNVTLNITSDLTAETGAVALNEVAGGFSVTIRPSGADRTISGSTSANAIIRINGADNVTIDGSLPPPPMVVGGNPAIRNLTVQNTSTAATGAAVIMVSEGTNGANNVTIKNVNVLGQDPTQTLLGIHVGGNTVGTSPTVAPNNNSRIENCSIRRAILGIFNNGLTATPATGTVITQNDMSATGADRLRRAGIFFFNQDGIQVTENSIGGIETNEGADAIGIIAGIQNVTSTVVTGGGVSNANISRNKINGVVNNGATGFSAAGIALAGGTLGPNTIANNMVTGVSAASTSPDLVAGIFIASATGSNTRVLYNSVAMTGDRAVTGGSATQMPSFGLAYTADVALEVKNNIFYTTQVSTGGGAGAESYAIGTLASAFANLDSNYNSFWSTGANDSGFRSGSLAASAGTDYADLAVWQAAVSDDANSQEVDPLFVSDLNDLHLQVTTPVENDGTPIAGITDDIDGHVRDATPNIGADEFVAAVPGTLAFSSATYSIGEGGGTVTLTVNRTGGTDGAVTVDYALANGTATGGATCAAGIDFVNSGGTVSFADGESTKTFNVAICEDTTFEADEDFTATLSNATGGATIGSPNPASVTITENKGQPTAQFSSATYSTNEPFADSGVGPGIAIEVTLSGASQSTVTVDYATSGGTATGGGTCTPGVDYVTNTGTLTFLTGETSKTFFVATCIDTTFEGDETVNLALSNPVGTTLGTPNSAILTIVENDPAAPVTVTATAGTASATYNTLTEAVAAINAGTHQGDIVVTVNQSTTEPASVVLNGSGAGPATYTSILIKPGADNVTVSGASVQGRGLIELNGADNVTIDGDNPGTAGINRNLTLQNTAANTVTFTSVVRIALAATVTNSADGNTVKNVKMLGSATGRNIATAVSTTASENTTFGFFAGPGASTTDQTAAPAAVTSVATGVTAGATASNLNVSNNEVMNAARAISVNGSATTVAPGLVIDGNVIGNPTAGDPDQVYAIGITAQGSTNAIISDNSVWIEGYVPASASTHAINVGVNNAAITGATIERNRVNRVRNNNGATWSAFGINLGGGASHIVQNNFISGVINSQVAGTGGFGTTFGAYGIRIASGTGHKIYHNSVNLYGALPGNVSTDLTAAFVITSTTLTGIDVRNNIFANRISGGNPTGTRNVAVFLPSGGTAAFNLTWNNNAYFVGSDALNRLAQTGTTFGAGEFQAAGFDPNSTTPATNFRSYTSTLSAAGTNDNASFATTANPPFTTDVDLHIPAATATRLESGGAAVGVADDIDLESRNATTPDIGADEFAGTAAPPDDMAAGVFVSPLNGANVPTGAAFAPQATFVNQGTAAQTNVTVRYKIIDSSMATVYDQTATIPTIAPLQSVPVTFPNATLTAPGTYTIQATAELAGDTNPANDQITGTINGLEPFSGTINVGTGETFTSLTNAGGVFQALNNAGISGNLTVQITSDLTAETGAVPLNQLAEAGVGGYTVVFKPSGAPRVISGTGAANQALIKLNGADRIVFDGSLGNTLGGTDRSLTITNNQTGTSTVFWIAAVNAGNAATNNTIKNCIINGTGTTTAQTTAGILGGSGTTIGGAAEAPNNDNTVTNNHIFGVQNGIYNQGATSLDQNWVVTNNEFGSATEAQKNRFRGMLMGNANNFTISGNTVLGVTNFTSTTGANTGIQLAFSLTNGTVTNNRISNVRNLSATGTGAFGMQLGATTTTNVLIANNFIWDIEAVGSATVVNNAHGININGAATTGAYKIYHNSINMNVNQTSGTTSALNVTSAVVAAGAIDLRNNILANTQTTGATRFGVFSAAAASVFSTIDYNDYFAQNVGSLGGTTRTTLGDWQTATGQDANSLAVDPLFVSATDLHIQATSPVLGEGVGGLGVTTDIDGETRDAVPDMGADEIPASATPGSIQFSSATYSVGEAGGTVTLTLTRTGGSGGAVSATYGTANGTATGGATCGAGVDYVSITGGTANWADGDTAPKTFDVTICNDAVFEGNEDFTASISATTGGATVGTPSSATVTIADDDPAPSGTIVVDDVRVHEGNTGGANAVFTVTYTGVNPAVASVNYATASGTAVSGVDFLPASGTLNFSSGTSLTVTVPIIGKVLKEANETFFLNLSGAVNATIADNQGVGIIIDEDRAYNADFDRDLIADLSIFRPSEGTWYVFRSASLSPLIVPFGSPGDRPVPGDYDGDGLTDFAVFRPSEGKWYVSNSTNGSVVTTTWGTTGDKPVQGDYDGDGKTDIAIFRPSDGNWWIIRSSDSISYTVNFGVSTDLPMQGDYDGDFRADPAVYRDGAWFALLSSNSTVQVVNFGLATDKPVSGDFDGDGKYDAAIFRDGDWWYQSSLTGNASFVHWGLAGDIPVPADFDADGTTDIAIYRPSTGEWYVLRSSDNSYFSLQWGLSGDIPIPSSYIPQ